jgi:hypothetical protein
VVNWGICRIATADKIYAQTSSLRGTQRPVLKNICSKWISSWLEIQNKKSEKCLQNEVIPSTKHQKVLLKWHLLTKTMF